MNEEWKTRAAFARILHSVFAIQYSLFIRSVRCAHLRRLGLRLDQIVMATSISCGSCFYCRRRWPNLCVDLAPMGFSFAGGMAEYVVIPSLALRNGRVIKTPRDLPPERAALSEPR